MNYFLTKTQRSLMILAVAILIIEMLLAITFGWLNPANKPDVSILISLKAFHVIAYGFVMFTLFEYFRHHGLKALQITTLVLAITEIISKIITTYHSVNNVILENMPQINQVLFIANSIILNISMVLWIILLLTASRKTYPGLFYLQKYGIGVIVLFVMGFLLGYLFTPKAAAMGWRIIHITTALNYLFLLEFALKLPVNDPQEKLILK